MAQNRQYCFACIVDPAHIKDIFTLLILYSIRSFEGKIFIQPETAATRMIRGLVPDYMAMGSAGMAEMGAMEMPLPDNTLPMMTGQGPFGPLEMGGMFTVVKVHEDVKPGDYTDPGWYRHPQGTVAWEWNGEPLPVERMEGPAADEHTLRAVKPTGHGMHHD